VPSNRQRFTAAEEAVRNDFGPSAKRETLLARAIAKAASIVVREPTAEEEASFAERKRKP
jgi:hypothetical protein